MWWQNPHIRYDVAMKMPDGSTQSWALLPPGNLPTYRRENWSEQTIQVGYQVTATGNLGRDGAKKLYATCHQHRHRTRTRPPARPLRE